MVQKVAVCSDPGLDQLAIKKNPFYELSSKRIFLESIKAKAAKEDQ